MTDHQNINHTPAEYQTPPPEDQTVFRSAAERLVETNVIQAIKLGGGDRQHINHFSREKCDNKPVAPWSDGQDHEDIKVALIDVAEGLEG